MNVRRIGFLGVLLCATAFNVALKAQDRNVINILDPPAIVTIHQLAANPSTFDGRLVRVTGVPTLGWEGDNFLHEWPEQKKGQPASLWFYCPPKTGQEIFTKLETANVRGRFVLFVFLGYFHFVPQRVKKGELFDPGPLQLELLRASQLTPHTD